MDLHVWVNAVRQCSATGVPPQGYIFMAMHSFVPPFREAKFCGVPSCVFDKLGCAAGEESLRNAVLR
jgi:hypothetical protein